MTDRVIAIMGNFDGVHRGHQALINVLRVEADAHALRPLILTFDPHPKEFFKKEVPARLTTMVEKLFYFKSRDDACSIICLPFDEVLSHREALHFAKEILVKKFHIAHMVVGPDFHFGFKRQGDAQTLQAAGIRVTTVATVLDQGERVSSSLIRSLLAHNNLIEAERLLGHPYAMIGPVIHGDSRGRTLGFPTANIALARVKSPLQGIYTVKVYGLNDTFLPGVASIGTRPAVDGKNWLLEVHLLDFNAMIYGQTLRVEFCHFLREEKNFSSLQTLQEQIAHDVNEARSYFA